MENGNLSVASLLFILTERGISPDDANKELVRASDVVSELASGGFFRGMTDVDISICRSLVLRSLVSTGLDESGFKENILDIYGSSALNDAVSGVFPPQLAVTALSGAINHYKDFLLNALIYSKVDIDEYNQLIKAGDDVLIDFLKNAVSLFKSNGGRYQDLYMFCSLLENIVTSTMFPLIEGLSSNAMLMNSFVGNPHQALIPVRGAMLDKLKNSLYLADALINGGDNNKKK